jgi:arsenate reductase
MHILILCTGNSARSQMAEAMFNLKGTGRVMAESAGSRPAERVNPFAMKALAEAGIDWRGKTPRGTAGLEAAEWDVVITVCDNARESCPVFPAAPVMAHWGMPDPAEVEGSDQEKFFAFRSARDTIARRIDRTLALDLEHLDRESLRNALNAIGQDTQ